MNVNIQQVRHVYKSVHAGETYEQLIMCWWDIRMAFSSRCVYTNDLACDQVWYGSKNHLAIIEKVADDGVIFLWHFSKVSINDLFSLLNRENRQNLHIFNLWPVIYHTKKNSCANPTPETLSVEIYTSQHDYPKSTRFYFVAIDVSLTLSDYL